MKNYSKIIHQAVLPVSWGIQLWASWMDSLSQLNETQVIVSKHF